MGEPRFRGIDELAQRCGHYAWTERRLFELAGTVAAGPGRPVARVVLSVVSRRRAALAAQWEERLPVRDGVDRGALVAAPPGRLATALDALAGAPSADDFVAGLVTVLLPRLLAAYEDDRVSASPVAEGPVIATLDLSACVTRDDMEDGRALLAGAPPPGSHVTELTEFCQDLNRQFQGGHGVFPGA